MLCSSCYVPFAEKLVSEDDSFPAACEAMFVNTERSALDGII